ncbi:MAG: glutamine synthetase family protein [Elusimicrobiaceae bacterium]|nr:glutamine synthetase family protein [Elusimicrobiaceae bacterium]
MTFSDILNPNPLARFLDKNPRDFTRADIIRYIEETGVQMINYRYAAGDGRLKTLNFVISGRNHLEKLLTEGERVDGSSLFKYIDSGASDLYVIPRLKTAFRNPFSPIPTLDLLCTYYTASGEPMPAAPDNILRKAQTEFTQATGMTFEAMGELEYYVISERDNLYPASSQSGYHESGPFAKWENLRTEAMQAIASAGGKIKYGHSEVGFIREADREMIQAEIEFLPVPVEDAADQLLIAKWILNMTGYRHGVQISFAPKISVGHAGSGMHIHTRLMKDGRSMMIQDGKLSPSARKMIAGFLKLAPSLTSFGNTVPTSYLRLVPHQEAPTNICWGDRNRSTLVRVPLGWTQAADRMFHDRNPQDTAPVADDIARQTVEFRAPDGSANIHLLLAGLTVAARHGLVSAESLEMAEKLYVDVNIFSEKHRAVQEKLPKLPASCQESAEKLIDQRAFYEEKDVFPAALISRIAENLASYSDRNLSESLYGKDEEIRKLVNEYIYR